MKTFRDILNEGKSEDLRKKLIDFFTNTKNVDDAKVHKFSDELKINTHEFETEIYSILVDFFQAGKYFEAKKKPKLDKTELEMGIEVEMEHTNSKQIAEKIAKDHLTEDDKYYTKLKEAKL